MRMDWREGDPKIKALKEEIISKFKEFDYSIQEKLKKFFADNKKSIMYWDLDFILNDDLVAALS